MLLDHNMASISEGRGDKEPAVVEEPYPDSEAEPGLEISPGAEISDSTMLYAVILLYSVIILLTIGLNALIIVGLKRRKLLGNVINIYLLSLVISRMLIGALVVPVNITGLYSQRYLGNIMCKTCHFIGVGSSATSVMSFAGMALVKYREIVINKGTFRGLDVPVASVIGDIRLIWLCGHLYAIRAAILNGIFFNGKTWTCNILPINRSMDQKFIFVDMICLFALPVIVIKYCYVKIQGLEEQRRENEMISKYKEVSTRRRKKKLSEEITTSESDENINTGKAYMVSEKSVDDMERLSSVMESHSDHSGADNGFRTEDFCMVDVLPDEKAKQLSSEIDPKELKTKNENINTGKAYMVSEKSVDDMEPSSVMESHSDHSGADNGFGTEDFCMVDVLPDEKAKQSSSEIDPEELKRKDKPNEDNVVVNVIPMSLEEIEAAYKKMEKTFKMTTVLVSLFVVSSTAPYILGLASIWLGTSFESYEYVHMMVYLISYSNSWINATVVLIFRGDIRQGIRDALPCIFKHCKAVSERPTPVPIINRELLLLAH